MTDRPCHDSIPRACAEAFAGIRETLGRIESISKATHQQATETNGRVSQLFTSVGEHSVELATLTAEMNHVQAKQHQQDTLARKFLAAGWRLAVMLAGVVASILGLKQLLR